MFKLEPIKPLKKMKITEEKRAFFYLLDNGFTEKEIDFIKKSGEKEGIKFCVKTFLTDDLDEVKQELREYLEKQRLKKVISSVKHLFNQYPKNLSMTSYY